jgi:exo-beta-1,3-glucanase (GH17 family)
MMIALLATCFAALAIGYWVARSQPRPVAEGPSDRVQCVSYAPFRKAGESPFIEETMVSEARLLEDLRLLSARTGCVRTYSVRQGLDAVPRVAQSLGMKVMLGVWLGRDRVKNELELERGIALANQFPDTVSALIVGNEVLLRRELPESVLAGYVDRARRQAAVPVTYADVWEFWMEHRGLADHVSFVTIHILPYWEDDPVAIDVAIAHIVTIAEEMRKAFGGKDVLIGETGWPSAGRSRRAAVASRVNQARFFRQFSLAAAQHKLRYNFIEAFDQPWKRRMEGAMGGQWGLFDSQGEAKFPATGPVKEDPHAYRGLAAAAAGLLLFVLVAARRRARGWHLLTAAAVGATSGAVLAAQWQYMVIWNRYATEWAATGACAALALAFAAISLQAIRRRLAPGLQSPAAALSPSEAAHAATAIPPFSSVLASWRAGRRIGSALQWLSLLRIAFLFGGAAMAVLLVFDARYRGFPMPLYALPLMSLLLLLAAGFRTSVFDIEEAVLATIILVGAIVFIPMERLSNLQALVFGLQLIVLAGAATGFRYWRFQARAGRLEAADQAGA